MYIYIHAYTYIYIYIYVLNLTKLYMLHQVLPSAEVLAVCWNCTINELELVGSLANNKEAEHATGARETSEEEDWTLLWIQRHWWKGNWTAVKQHGLVHRDQHDSTRWSVFFELFGYVLCTHSEATTNSAESSAISKVLIVISWMKVIHCTDWHHQRTL